MMAAYLLPQQISESLEPVDGTLSAQVELLKDALESGIDFNQKDNNDDEVQSAMSSTSELEVDGKGKDKEHSLTDEMMEDSQNGQLGINKGKQHNINNNC